MVETVLIIEDNEKNLYLMEYLLKHAGMNTLSANSGVRGLAMAKAERPSLILMDIQLPEMDGFETTRRLKQEPETSGIPIIAVSSFATESSRKAAWAAGVSAYIAKPIQPEQFIEQIKQFLP